MALIEIDLIKYLFSPKGRVGQLRFFLTHIIIVMFFLSAAAIILEVTKDMEDDILNFFIYPIIGILYLIMFYVVFCNYIKRMHDLGKSGYYVLFIFVPIVNFYWIIKMFVSSGTIGTNIYGEKP